MICPSFCFGLSESYPFYRHLPGKLEKQIRTDGRGFLFQATRAGISAARIRAEKGGTDVRVVSKWFSLDGN
ncbi:MAG: hypothetical protein DRH37_00470 [Deltaproteobacteria bacterium]|nr:MAG: hypothetical protein DRH37_00470 [Deltaproteobacteria bacterium]